MMSLSSQKKRGTNPENQVAWGPNLSFSASEAYKRLRTSLAFCLPKNAERNCRIVGITSALGTEGKSTTALNLAYSIAESGQLVLLIDGDMRLPRLAKRLKLQATPGLSECLAGEINDGNAALRQINENLYVMPAGSIPPNPSELLLSARMRRVTETLAQNFHYIIIDLPPVGAVADALTVAELVDGMIMVVRKNYSTKRALTSAVRELNFANAKILGFVFNDASADSKKGKKGYRSYSYYGRYASSSYMKKRPSPNNQIHQEGTSQEDLSKTILP